MGEGNHRKSLLWKTECYLHEVIINDCSIETKFSFFWLPLVLVSSSFYLGKVQKNQYKQTLPISPHTSLMKELL